MNNLLNYIWVVLDEFNTRPTQYKKEWMISEVLAAIFPWVVLAFIVVCWHSGNLDLLLGNQAVVETPPYIWDFYGY